MSRNFTVLEIDQRSDAWRRARAGRICASQAGDMMAQIKSGEAAARRELRAQLVTERFTGQPVEEGFVSFDMKRGADLEPLARVAYEAETGELVREVGFVQHSDLMAGYSPDGVIGDFQGLVEIKVPKLATHLRYLRDPDVPREHLHQLQHALWITGAQWIDFVSFSPQFPPALRLKVTRYSMTAAQLRAYALMVQMFLTEVDQELAAVTQLLHQAEEGTAA